MSQQVTQTVGEIDKVPRAKPRRGKARVKVTKSGKRVSYGQAGKAKGGGPRVKPGTSKGDSYCARSYGIKKRVSKKKRTLLTIYPEKDGSVQVKNLEENNVR